MNTNGANKESANYDEHLRFELPEGYEIERGTNSYGEPTFIINNGVTIDVEGRKLPEEAYVISKDPIDINDVESNINCNFSAVVRGVVQDVSYKSYNMKAIIGAVGIIFGDTCYSVHGTSASKAEAERVLLKTEGLANNLTKIVNCMVIDGTKVTIDPIPVSLIFEEEDYSEFRKTDPSDKQHTHLDFLSSTKGALGFLGALSVNQNGTEYAFYPVSDLDLDPMAEVILDKYSVTDFELAETAYKMSELFRVRLEAFNQSHDREQEIKKGLIHKVALYESFRSFAWTLSAYCAGKGVKPADVSYEILCKMCRFIESRKGLNYTDWAFSPAICSGDDIHIYYLPAMSSEDNKSIAKYLQVKEEAGKCQNIVSLDALRSELTYLYPAVETIYNSLRAERDDGEPLEGGVADVLYVWCAMTYAARQPIYSEDGPMNCSFSHPGEMDQIPAEYRRMMEELEKREKDQIKREKEEKKRQAIEKARRAAEEARKKEEDAKKKAEAEQKAWEEEAKRIKETRESIITQKRLEIEEKRKADLKATEDEKAASIARNEQAVEEAIKAVADMEKELSSLGFFAIGKKNELKKSIESGKINIQNLKAKKESILKEYDDKAAAVNRKAASDSDDVRYVIEMHYPIPESPKEKERKRKEAEKEKRRQEEELKAQKELISKLNDREKELYKELCACYGDNFYVTPSILAGFTFGGSNRSNPKAHIASAFLHKLEAAGMLNWEIRDGATRYILKKVI